MEITAKGTLKLAHKAAQASRKEGAAACRPWSTCTARNGKPRKLAPKDAAAASRLAESAPPLKATTSPVAPAGTWASRAACREAAEKLMKVYVACGVERRTMG